MGERWLAIDGILAPDLSTTVGEAEKAESNGFDGVWSGEIANDPFLALLLAAEHTERVAIGSSIVVAFGRSPLTVAHSAWDVNNFSGGRLLLGIGSQIKPHIERRYSMPWTRPAARMREYIAAMRAIWDSWQHGTDLDFRGEFYNHTLMTPFFKPRPNRFGPPKVFLAAVGDQMTKVAADVADGLLVHGFSTERYLREVTVPTIEAGLSGAGRDRSAFQISYPAMVVVGDDDEQLEIARAGTKRQIAFYASTPAYRAVLERHGWEDLQTDLGALAHDGRWPEMEALISTEVLDTFAVCGSPEVVAGELSRRYADLVDRIGLYLPYELSPKGELTARVVAGLASLRTA